MTRHDFVTLNLSAGFTYRIVTIGDTVNEYTDHTTLVLIFTLSCAFSRIQTRLRAGRPGSIPGRSNVGVVFFATASRPILGPTQPPIQRGPGALSPRVKRPRREADNSLPSSAEVKNAWSYTSTLSILFMVRLIKQWIRLHGVVLC
jgi:hypothetical protein